MIKKKFVLIRFIDAHEREGYDTAPSEANFQKKIVNKNAKKAKVRDPLAIFPRKPQLPGAKICATPSP